MAITTWQWVAQVNSALNKSSPPFVRSESTSQPFHHIQQLQSVPFQFKWRQSLRYWSCVCGTGRIWESVSLEALDVKTLPSSRQVFSSRATQPHFPLAFVPIGLTTAGTPYWPSYMTHDVHSQVAMWPSRLWQTQLSSVLIIDYLPSDSPLPPSHGDKFSAHETSQ